MFDLDVSLENGYPCFSIKNCDKDGSLVAKRLASSNGGISDTRALEISVDREVDKFYVTDMAEKLVGYYLKHAGGKIDFSTLVMGSVHRAALYTSECLNCPVLPLQFIGFASNWGQASEA